MANEKLQAEIDISDLEPGQDPQGGGTFLKIERKGPVNIPNVREIRIISTTPFNPPNGDPKRG